MSTKEQYWKYSLIIIIVGLGIILFRQITPFLSGLLGALTIYILVRRQMIYLSEKRKMKRSIAATIITAEAILCFLIPLALVVWLAIINLQNINLDPQAIIAPFEQTAAIIKAKTGYNILGGDSLSFVLSSLPRIGQTLMGGISSFAVNMFVLVYNPQIQISAESETKRSIFREKDKTKRSKKESAQHSKSRNKSFVMTSVSAL